MPSSFLIALRFLTRIPAPEPRHWSDQHIGRSLLSYPLIGCLLGGLLLIPYFALTDAPPMLSAALILTFWIWLSGGLHLDGLADSADAWVGGMGDRDKTLLIMKDPASGPSGVSSLIIILLLKFTALHYLLSNDQHWLWLFLSPVIGRSSLLALFLTTRYIRSQGMGAALSQHLPKTAASLILITTLFLITALVAMMTTLNTLATLFIILGSSTALFVFVRHLIKKRIGGTTGDTAGALLELTETTVLISAVLCSVYL